MTSYNKIRKLLNTNAKTNYQLQLSDQAWKYIIKKKNK